MKIDEVYKALLTEDTDVRHHLPILKKLATARHVTEIGTRRAISTCALVAGRPISLTCYDLVREPDIDNLEIWANEVGVRFAMHIGDVNDLEKLAGPVDFAFLDAQHTAIPVAHQIRLGAAAGAHTIASHDTEIFGLLGDDHTEENPKDGILVAFDNFIIENPEWKIIYTSLASYGLTVMSKLQYPQL